MFSLSCRELIKFFPRCNQYFSKRPKSYFVTTPIFYVNSNPHIGHLYTMSLADAACKWNKLTTPDSDGILVTGTDEHGLKIEQSAKNNNVEDVQLFCDHISAKFENLCRTFDIGYYDFVRTTEHRHLNAVTSFWKQLEENGCIYKGVYEGWYCTSDEMFLTSKQVEKVEDLATGEVYHISVESGHRVEWTCESNYMFKLSHFIPQIKSWLTSSEDELPVYPRRFRDQALQILEQHHHDLSISRARSKVKWGIPVPGDPAHTVYVWVDALVNYLTAAGYPDRFRPWPPDVQIIGVDILKFHAIYWPALLLAVGLPLPRKLVVHSHWTIDHVKMSKSRGNVVDPHRAARHCSSAEGLKYFLLRQSVLEHDCNFARAAVAEALNSDLAHVIGNCVNRVAAPKLNPAQRYPAFDRAWFESSAAKDDRAFVELVRGLPAEADAHARAFRFHDAIFCATRAVREANALVHRNRLWTRGDVQRDTLLHCAYEGARVACILLQPFLPSIVARALTRLGVPPHMRTFRHASCCFAGLSDDRDDDDDDALVGKPLGDDRSVLFKTVKVDRLPQSNAKTKKKTKNDVVRSS